MTKDELEARMREKFKATIEMIEDDDFDVEKEMEDQETVKEEPMSYQEFISDCRSGGDKTMKQCAKEWKEYKKQLEEEAPTTKEEAEQLKEKREELQDVSEKEVPEAKEEDVLNDVLVVTEGCSSCEKVANYLATPILSSDIKVVGAKTSQGQNIIAQMPDDISIPLYAVEKKKGYEHRDFRTLFEKYKKEI